MKLVTILWCVLLFSFSAFSQVTDQEQDLIERAKMVAEIQQLRTENTALKTQVAELKIQVDIYKRVDEIQENRIADLKEALAHRTDALKIDFRLEELYKTQVADFRDENLRLRNENEKLRKSRDRRSLIFGAIGLAAGKFIW